MGRGAGSGLLERDRELQAIARLIEETSEGRGGLIIVDGPAGIGKTRLLEATRARAQAAGFAQLVARGGVLERSHPFGLVRALLDPVIRERAASESLGDILGVAEPLFDPEAGTHPHAATESALAMLLSLSQVVIDAAARGPLLVSVDDAHWADAESLRFLSALTGRLIDHPVLLIVAWRRHDPGASRELLGQLLIRSETHHLAPAPLSSDAVATLLRTELGAEADPAFVLAFASATGGNPFMCTELVRTLADEGLAPRAEYVGHLIGLAPEAVARSVLARLALLPEAAQRAAAALSVVEGKGAWRLVSALTELEHEVLSEAFDMLADAGVVRRDATPEFLHPMLRTAVYEDLPVSRRDHDHHRAAALLAQSGTADEDEIAAHLLLTRPRGETWVAEQLGRAAANALRQGAADAAAAYLARALEESPGGELGTTLLADLGEAESRRGESGAAATALRAARERSEDPVRRAELSIPLALALTRLGRAPEGMEVLEDAVAGLPADAVEIGQAIETEIEVIAHLNGQAGRLVRGRDLRFPRPPDAPDSAAGERLAFAGRADVAMNRGRADEASELALLALRDGELMRQEGSGIVLFFSTAIVLLYCDRLDEAERVYRDALVHAEERGRPHIAASARGFLAGVHLRRGQLGQAESAARMCLESTLGSGEILRTTFAGAFLIEALVERGELGHATRALTDLRAQDHLPDALIVNILQHARGRLRSAGGDHRGALADHLEGGRRAAEWDMHTPAVANWRSLAAAEYAALGRDDDACRYAEAGTESARRFGSPRALGMALGCEGAIRRDLDQLREAVEILRAGPARLESARALIALGSAERRNGARTQAREDLEEGLRLARVCGAVPLARAADEELTVLGSRARRVTRAGADGLTASEHRVAALAAGGYSNRQIADALVLSVRTVETHLAHCYQKLGIEGRRQIAEVLEPEIA